MELSRQILFKQAILSLEGNSDTSSACSDPDALHTLLPQRRKLKPGCVVSQDKTALRVGYGL